MQFHEIDLFDFTSFFLWTFLNFLARCAGQRKILMVNVTCLFETSYEQNHQTFEQVAHLKYKSKLMQIGVDLNTIDLSQTEVEINVRPEERVFGGYCAPEVNDYLGS